MSERRRSIISSLLLILAVIIISAVVLCDIINFIAGISVNHHIINTQYNMFFVFVSMLLWIISEVFDKQYVKAVIIALVVGVLTIIALII